MKTKLREYLDLHHITHRGFAADVGISTATMYNIINAKHMPNLRDALAIERKTRGYVRCEDWFDDKYQPENEDDSKNKKSKENITRRSKL